jgi:hypothetical protein
VSIQQSYVKFFRAFMGIPRALTQTPAKDDALGGNVINATVTSEWFNRQLSEGPSIERSASGKILEACIQSL